MTIEQARKTLSHRLRTQSTEVADRGDAQDLMAEAADALDVASAVTDDRVKATASGVVKWIVMRSASTGLPTARADVEDLVRVVLVVDARGGTR